jgi:hypothetical protein
LTDTLARSTINEIFNQRLITRLRDIATGKADKPAEPAAEGEAVQANAETAQPEAVTAEPAPAASSTTEEPAPATETAPATEAAATDSAVTSEAPAPKRRKSKKVT